MISTKNILASIGKHVELTEEEAQHFTTLLIPAQVKHGEFLETPGELSRYSIYVNMGCLMTYYTDKEGNHHVVQFASSGWWTADLNSLIHRQPSIYTTEALTDSEVFLINYALQEKMYTDIPKLERYFRIITQNALVTHQQRIIQNFALTAEERYLTFQKKYPSLEQYVPLKHIASYLGITPEFLSRIRRKLMDK